MFEPLKTAYKHITDENTQDRLQSSIIIYSNIVLACKNEFSTINSPRDKSSNSKHW